MEAGGPGGGGVPTVTATLPRPWAVLTPLGSEPNTLLLSEVDGSC